MKLEDVKNTWNEYSSLIYTIMGVVSALFTGIAFVAGLIITSMVSTTIKEEAGQVKAVTNLVASVSALTTAIENADGSITRLDGTIIVLQRDVTDIHKHLAGID